MCASAQKAEAAPKDGLVTECTLTGVLAHPKMAQRATYLTLGMVQADRVTEGPAPSLCYPSSSGPRLGSATPRCVSSKAAAAEERVIAV